MSPQAIETPHPKITQIVTGWFHERHKYSAWRPRGTDDWLLVCTLGGRGRFGFADGELIADPGDLVLLRPGTLHDYGLEPTRQRWDLLWTHFHPRPHWMDWLNWPAFAPGLMRLRLEDRTLRRRIEQRFAAAHALATTARSRREDLAMNALEELLLWCDGINPAAQSAKIDSRIQAVMDHICRNVSEKITLDTLADLAGLSVSRFAHLFRQQAGTTPQQFLELQRINRAKQLLELTAMSVKEISAEVGYENPFYFTLRFKRNTGKSPRTYRREIASIAAARL
jgi:AraC family transcriptional regulator, arabinose operon regulatory protein